MTIGNRFFFPTSEFSFWYIIAQLRIDPNNKTIQYN